MVFDSIIYKLKLKINNRIWRRENPHNYTFCANYFPLDILSVGKQTYGTLFVYVWNKDIEKLIIGNYCSIAEGVKFILGGNHHYDTMLTYPFKVMKFRTQTVEAISKGPIVIEDDVWIGINALILCGVRIGKGAVIGAGSVVTKDVPPYSIVAGNPAKIIKKRFSDEIIDYLLQVDFNKINFSHTNIDDLYQSITNIDDLKNLLHKLDYLNE